MLVASCSVALSSERYEMTAVVETPQGAIIRSGVWKVRWIGRSSPFPGPSAYSKVYGEAVPIPLGGKRYIIMLVGSMAGSWENMAPWQERSDPRYKAVLNGVRVQVNQNPYFVYFPDIDDMKSARKIKVGDASSVLGNGYIIKGVWMQKTSKPLTSGMSGWIKKIKWVDEIGNHSIQGTVGCKPSSEIPCLRNADLINKENENGK